MRVRRLGLGTAALALAAALATAAAPAVAASTWWRPAVAPKHLTQVAQNSERLTLGIAAGRAGWFAAGGTAFVPVAGGPAAEVAAAGKLGVVLQRDGWLVEANYGLPARRLQRLPGTPIGLAVAPAPAPTLVAATSEGVFWGRLGTRLRRVPGAPDPPLALADSAGPKLPFVVAFPQGIFTLSRSGRLQESKGSPRLGAGAALAELSDGVVLAGSRSGLIWGLYSTGWQAVFQILPSGGLSGVPDLTAIQGVGASAAYVATLGFGTLLTPDGGYTWYRAAPGGTYRISALSALGPVSAAKPSGYVVAVTSRGLFLHRLQALPAPPVYQGRRRTLDLLWTALVTLVGSGLVVVAMYARRRQHRRRLFV